MDAYTQHLLGLAASRVIEFRWYPSVMGGVEQVTVAGRFHSEGLAAGFSRAASAPNLASALAALLTDLGVEVPELPSVDGPPMPHPVAVAFLEALRRDYAREPLTVLALLEGE